MSERHIDITDLLIREREYHIKQIEKIDAMLRAADAPINEEKKETSTKTDESQVASKRDRTIPWKAEIHNLFEIHKRLTTEEVRNKLIEKGIPEANSDRGRNNIYSTISRMASDGFLEKDEHGVYEYKQENNGDTMVRTKFYRERGNQDVTP